MLNKNALGIAKKVQGQVETSLLIIMGSYICDQKFWSQLMTRNYLSKILFGLNSLQGIFTTMIGLLLGHLYNNNAGTKRWKYTVL